MSTNAGFLSAMQKGDTVVVNATGQWTLANGRTLAKAIDTFSCENAARIEFNFQAVQIMDTAGALLARQLIGRLAHSTPHTVITNPAIEQIFKTLERHQNLDVALPQKSPFLIEKLTHIGKATVDAIVLVACFVVFIGEIPSRLLVALIKPARFRLGQTATQIELSGFNAIPIISLISFLIGIVVAYQGALQLGKLGADIYTVDLLAVTILREMGVLLAAVVIAGRSGSTFAAEIGSMKLRQEIDAMRTIGMDPIELLVLPRVLGLVISLPILTLFANFFGVLGGGVMLWLSMDMSAAFFVNQFISGLPPWAFWVGMIKAPVFAAIIAVIGCYEGMQVRGNSESLGKHTTRAVVESIFLIIVFDALFSIFFGIVGI